MESIVLEGENRSEKTPGKKPAYAVGDARADSSRFLHATQPRGSSLSRSRPGLLDLMVEGFAFQAVQIETRRTVAGFQPDCRILIARSASLHASLCKGCRTWSWFFTAHCIHKTAPPGLKPVWRAAASQSRRVAYNPVKLHL